MGVNCEQKHNNHKKRNSFKRKTFSLTKNFVILIAWEVIFVIKLNTSKQLKALTSNKEPTLSDKYKKSKYKNKNKTEYNMKERKR